MMRCKKCNSDILVKDGFNNSKKLGKRQRYRCKDCGCSGIVGINLRIGKHPEIVEFFKNYYKTHKHPMLGKHHSEKTKHHWSKIRIGSVPWNKGLPMKTKTKDKLSKIGFEKWQSKDYRENQIKLILHGLMKRPTSLEVQMEQIIKNYNLPYKYVGDGSLLIGFKNPDFANTNGEKICIEVRHTNISKMFDGGFDNYSKERIEHFAKYGWKCLVLSEKDIDNAEKILRIRG